MNRTETLFFSVITPSWNQGEYIGECLRSVAAQNDPSVEHIVLDNCSADSTADVVREYPGTKFVREKDRGQSHAVNKGFAAAKGEIICWLNSDDAYPPETFARLRSIFADPAVSVVFGDVEQVSYDGRPPQRAEAAFKDRLDLVRWWSGKAHLHQPAVFFRKSVMEIVGNLREDLHYAMDYEYWWRMSEKFAFRREAEVLAVQYRQPESKTIRDWDKVLEEREIIFHPYYDLLGDKASVLAEKRDAVAAHHVRCAHAATKREDALSSILKAVRLKPALAISPSILGALRRARSL